MVFLFLWISKRKPPTLSKKDILPVCSLGVVQTGLQYIFTYIGIGFTSGTNTSIITACASFFTVLIGCILGFSGIIAINFGGTVSTDTWFGDMMILFSTISAAAGNIVAKKVTTGRDPFPVTAFQLLTGGFILLVSGICCGGSIGLINVESVSVLLWLAFVSAAAFSLWTALLKFHDASRISVFNLLVPVFGTVLSGLMLGENVFRIETLISLILISLGIAFVNMNLKKSGGKI